MKLFFTSVDFSLLVLWVLQVCELRKHFSFLFMLFLGLLSSPTLFTATGQQPVFVNVHGFLSQQNASPFLFLSELMDLFVAGRDQSAADQPNNLTEGHDPPL